MFLLVNNFKIKGMLLNVVHCRFKKANKNLLQGPFPNHSTLINYAAGKSYFGQMN